MSNVTALISTLDCSTAGCPNEADRPDGLCGYCRREQARRRLTLVHSTPEAPMTQRKTCSVTGCTNPTISDRGRYARVCATHKPPAVRAATRLKAAPPPAALAVEKVTPATAKLRLHDLFANHALSSLVDWIGVEPEVIIATARGRHAWGSIRYGDRLMYEYSNDELRANALEELADAVNYLTVLEQRLNGLPEPDAS